MFVGLFGNIIVYFGKWVVYNGYEYVYEDEENENYVGYKKDRFDEFVGVL